MCSDSLHSDVDLFTSSRYLVTGIIELLLELDKAFLLSRYLLEEVGSFFNGARDDATERANFLLGLSKVVMIAALTSGSLPGSHHHTDTADGILHLSIGRLFLLTRIVITLQAESRSGKQQKGRYACSDGKDI